MYKEIERNGERRCIGLSFPHGYICFWGREERKRAKREKREREQRERRERREKQSEDKERIERERERELILTFLK